MEDRDQTISVRHLCFIVTSLNSGPVDHLGKKAHKIMIQSFDYKTLNWIIDTVTRTVLLRFCFNFKVYQKHYRSLYKLVKDGNFTY